MTYTRHLCLFILSMILTSCLSGGTGLKKETAQYRLQIAGSLIKAGNYPEALKNLLLALDDDPSNQYIHASLGYVYFIRERYDLSEKHYLKSLAIKPDFTDVKNSLARTYIEVGRFNKAETLIKEALVDLTYSDYQKTFSNYGILEFKRKNFLGAVDFFKKSLQKDRENCVNLTYLGRSYTEANDLTSALPQLDKAITFCSQADSDEGHYYSAIALYRNNQPALALARFEEVIKLFPDGKNIEKSRKMIELIKQVQP